MSSCMRLADTRSKAHARRELSRSSSKEFRKLHTVRETKHFTQHATHCIIVYNHTHTFNTILLGSKLPRYRRSSASLRPPYSGSRSTGSGGRPPHRLPAAAGRRSVPLRRSTGSRLPHRLREPQHRLPAGAGSGFPVSVSPTFSGALIVVLPNRGGPDGAWETVPLNCGGNGSCNVGFLAGAMLQFLCCGAFLKISQMSS